MENNKKILVPTIVAVATLVLLVFGATYAYFTVGSTNNFGTKELNATVEDMADAVVLEQIEDELSLDVTRAMMSEDNAGTTYYASGSAIPANIAKISVAGEGKYACDYTINVTKSASSEENDLHEELKKMSWPEGFNNVFLNINGITSDLRDIYSFPKTQTGTITGITKDAPKYITANMSIKNKNENQNYLKGKDVTLTFEVTEFDCYLNEADESAPIYAIFDENKYTLAFYQNNDEVNVGDTYDGYTVTEVYTNLNNTNYTSIEDVPWYKEDVSYLLIANVTIEEIIQPLNTAYWFAGIADTVFNLENLDTSQVENMEGMFYQSNSGATKFEADLSNFDTSNVTDMSHMFYGAGEVNGFLVSGLEKWDTSKVEDMSYMFCGAGSYGGINSNISTWNTSNVTDMSHMFEDAGADDSIFIIGDITRREITANGKTYIAWDTSKVTNMNRMFANVAPNADYSLNLTSWQVPLVTNYTDFNLGVESKITPPTWVN